MQTASIDVIRTRKGGKMGTVTIDGAAIGSMVESALAFSAQMGGFPGADEARQAILGGDCATCGYLRHDLSKQIGQYLGEIDDTVQAVYAYEPEYAAGRVDRDSAHRAADPGISLLVSVDRRNAALNSVVASLEDAVKDGVSSLLCSGANGSCYDLDVKFADEEEVASRRGYGVLVSSLHAAPLKLWTREL